MPKPGIDILMYHSISVGSGPTRIAPDVFRQQMDVLAECGYFVVSLADAVDSLKSEGALPDGAVVLTFDDGFEDFATAAFPALRARMWPTTVFLPVGEVGGRGHWDKGLPLMDWTTVAELARNGVDFGGHGVHHVDLTSLTPEAAREEIVESRRRIEEHTSRPVVSFAAPYGKTNPAVRQEIRRHYRAAVGTRLARAGRESDLYDLPRIEMWYFRNPKRWRAYLQGRAQGYFAFRQTLRNVRGLVAGS